jgi:hypothetical protein
MKQRPPSHLVGEAGIMMVRGHLPEEWVLREYHPDYGIDLDVEVFSYSSGGELVSLGEHFFVQVKSRSGATSTTLTVHPRFNVEKRSLEVDRSKARGIAVLSVALSRSDLQLAQSLGPAVPILLFVCDVEAGTVHYLCLNDYVDKILMPEAIKLDGDSSLNVYIPTWNTVSRTESDLMPLRLYARRAKLYAAFNRIRYQQHELCYSLAYAHMHSEAELRHSELLKTFRVFLEIVKSYDFWQTTRTWPAIELAWLTIERLDANLTRFENGESLEAIYESKLKQLPESWPEDPGESSKSFFLVELYSAWDQLANLGNIFEEICREWFLPTFLASLSEDTAFR